LSKEEIADTRKLFFSTFSFSNMDNRVDEKAKMARAREDLEEKIQKVDGQFEGIDDFLSS